MFKNKGDICIIGMGRFGVAIAEQLIKLRKNVILIDKKEELLKPFEKQVTSLYVADATELNALEAIGIQDIETIVVAAPSNIEIVATLLELKVKYIIARATNKKNARVLQQIGVDHIVLPEVETGVRTALIAANDNFIKFSENMQELRDGFVIGSTKLFNTKLENRPLKSIPLTKRGISVILVKSGHKTFVPNGDTIIKRNDLITVIGQLDVVTDIFAIFNRQRTESVRLKDIKTKMADDK